jgi:hypothetical protein
MIKHLRRFIAATMILGSTQSIWSGQKTTVASGDRRVSLIELYTTEGCSSCPRADALLSSVKSRPDLWKSFIPLAFHVDYWDRLGWPDRFANTEWTLRQRRYAQFWRSRSVYTPGFAINGSEWRGFFEGQAFPAQAIETPGSLKLSTTNRTRWSITFDSKTPSKSDFTAHVARMTSGEDTPVAAGENRGRTLHHDFVVLDLSSYPLVKTGETYFATIDLPPHKSTSPTRAIAAWLTAGDNPTPIQASGGWFP